MAQIYEKIIVLAQIPEKVVALAEIRQEMVAMAEIHLKMWPLQLKFVKTVVALSEIP